MTTPPSPLRVTPSPFRSLAASPSPSSTLLESLPPLMHDQANCERRGSSYGEPGDIGGVVEHKNGQTPGCGHPDRHSIKEQRPSLHDAVSHPDNTRAGSRRRTGGQGVGGESQTLPAQPANRAERGRGSSARTRQAYPHPQ